MRHAFGIILWLLICLPAQSAGPLAPAAAGSPRATQDQAPDARGVTPRRKGARALLVGIDQYQAPENNLPAGSSGADVALMRELLTRHMGYGADEIQVLTNGEATRSRILAAFDDWLVGGSRPGDRVFFFFSGHGFYQKDEDGDEPDGYDEVLVAYDAQLVDKSTRPVRVANLISDDDIAARLDRLTDREVTLIVDSCHSGTISRAIGADPGLVRTIALRLPTGAWEGSRAAVPGHREDGAFIAGRDKLVAWSAVAPTQLALVDSETPQHQGVFTGRFKDGLAERAADANRDGLVTHAELHDYLQRESAAYCARHRSGCSAGLTPYLEAPPAMLARDVLTGRPATGTANEADNLLGHDNQAGLALEILPAARVRLGQEMAFRVTAAASGYLVVFDVNAAGQVTQLFPNRYSAASGKGNRIAAGEPVRIPDAYYGFRFTAGEPTGPGLLFAILTQDPIPLDDLLMANKDLEPVANPSAYLAILAGRLRLPVGKDGGQGTAVWSKAAAAYQIDP